MIETKASDGVCSYPNSYEIETIYAFVKKHFLHWLVAISIFGVISEAARELNIVQEVIQVCFRSILVLSSLRILSPARCFYQGSLAFGYADGRVLIVGLIR